MARTNESIWQGRTVAAAMVVVLALAATAGAQRGRWYDDERDERAARAEAARQRELAAALMKRQAAEHEFRGVVPRMVKRFETGRPYRDAVRSQYDAHAAYDAARERVLAEVRETAAWQRAAAELRRVVAEREAGSADDYRMAMRVLEARTAVTRIEAAALAGSPAVVEARDRLVAAGTGVRDLVTDFDGSIRESVEWKLARAAVDDAHVAVARLRASAGTYDGGHAAASRRPEGGPSGYEEYAGTSGGSSYEVGSKCEACGKRVADSSKVGDQCPHCGVTWGVDRRTHR